MNPRNFRVFETSGKRSAPLSEGGDYCALCGKHKDATVAKPARPGTSGPSSFDAMQLGDRCVLNVEYNHRLRSYDICIGDIGFKKSVNIRVPDALLTAATGHVFLVAQDVSDKEPAA